VIRDVEPFSIVGGVPAKLLRAGSLKAARNHRNDGSPPQDGGEGVADIKEKLGGKGPKKPLWKKLLSFFIKLGVSVGLVCSSSKMRRSILRRQ